MRACIVETHNCDITSILEVVSADSRHTWITKWCTVAVCMTAEGFCKLDSLDRCNVMEELES